jgi:hypothetical protein
MDHTMSRLLPILEAVSTRGGNCRVLFSGFTGSAKIEPTWNLFVIVLLFGLGRSDLIRLKLRLSILFSGSH